MIPESHQSRDQHSEGCCKVCLRQCIVKEKRGQGGRVRRVPPESHHFLSDSEVLRILSTVFNEAGTNYLK